MGTDRPFIHQRFSAIAKRHPEHIAVVQAHQKISYRQLDLQSDRIADRLLADGVCPGSRVAVYMPPKILFMAAILGVLKTASTGIPKGIPITHPGLVNLLDVFDALQPVGPLDRCALWSGLNFDVSVYEI
ncbi:MAG: AMP-binding protein [Desulfotignum sp.]